MNKRARNRLIGVTAIIVIIIAAIFASMSANQGAKAYAKVSEIREDTSAVGKRLTVGGTVIPGSWDKKSTDKLRFSIADGDKEGNIADPSQKLDVVYTGALPATFGDGVIAIITGELKAGGVIETREMLIKCPEKKSKGTAAMAVDAALQNKDKIAGLPVKVTGFVTAGSIKTVGNEPRFSIQTTDGVTVLPVDYSGGLSEGVKDGAQVVVGGDLEKTGVFNATSVETK